MAANQLEAHLQVLLTLGTSEAVGDDIPDVLMSLSLSSSCDVQTHTLPIFFDQ